MSRTNLSNYRSTWLRSQDSFRLIVWGLPKYHMSITQLSCRSHTDITECYCKKGISAGLCQNFPNAYTSIFNYRYGSFHVSSGCFQKSNWVINEDLAREHIAIFRATEVEYEPTMSFRDGLYNLSSSLLLINILVCQICIRAGVSWVIFILWISLHLSYVSVIYRAWSYHNGGSWPTLLWQFTVACIKMNRPDLAERAVEVAEKRLSRDRWPEYYDTKKGRFIGKQARLYQTWSIAGYLTSKLMLKNPEAANWLTCDEDDTYAIVLEASPKQKRKFKPSQNASLYDGALDGLITVGGFTRYWFLDFD